jgi:hypothetical protein
MEFDQFLLSPAAGQWIKHLTAICTRALNEFEITGIGYLQSGLICTMLEIDETASRQF